MISLRLTTDLEKKLNQIAKTENISKSEIIKKALIMYFNDNEKKYNPYFLGNDLFGKYGSGKSNLSKDYKNILKGKLFEKYNR
jgi:predicted DNA-binding protein